MQMRKILFSAFLASVLLYGLFAARGVMFPPKLKVLSPKNYSTINSTKIVLSGITDPSLTLWVGGKTVQSNESGFFEEVLYVYPGYNEIGIKVQNKFGRESKKILKLAVE